MPDWECAIDGCGRRFAAADRAIDHQEREHDGHECRVCGTVVADGYPAISHTIEEHTRVEYVRAYGASSDDVREREAVKDAIERETDLRGAVEPLGDG